VPEEFKYNKQSVIYFTVKHTEPEKFPHHYSCPRLACGFSVFLTDIHTHGWHDGGEGTIMVFCGRERQTKYNVSPSRLLHTYAQPLKTIDCLISQTDMPEILHIAN
jgi:hypothetical protein